MNTPIVRSHRLRVLVLWLAPAWMLLCWLRQDALAKPPSSRDEAREKIGVVPPDHRPDGLRIVPPPPARLRVELWTDSVRYWIGDDVRVYFRVERDARVYIFNTDASGHSSQIFPNAYDRDNWVRGGKTCSIPDSRYRLVATGPVGRESLTLVAYAEQTIFWREYHEFPSPSQPFPERPGGAKRMLDQLQGLGVESGAGKPSAPPPASGVPSPEKPDSTAVAPGMNPDSHDMEIHRREQKAREPESKAMQPPVDTHGQTRLRIEPLPPRPPFGQPLYGETTIHFYVDHGHFRPGPLPWRWEGPPRWPPRPLPYPTPVPPVPTPPFDPYQPPWWRP